MATTNDPHEDDSPWTQRGFILAAGVVAVIVVLAIALAVSGGDSGPDAQAPAAQTPAASPPSEPAVADGGSVCKLPAGSQRVPTGTPDRTQWELVGSMAAPTNDKTFGPGVTGGGFRTCFAHSPTGALYATVNFWAALTAKPGYAVYKQLASPSDAQRTAIKNDRAKPAKRLDGLQVAGFGFTSYDTDRAEVKVAFRLENGALLQTSATMLWRNGDWRYEVPLDQRPPTSQIDDLNGYITWKGT